MDLVVRPSTIDTKTSDSRSTKATHCSMNRQQGMAPLALTDSWTNKSCSGRGKSWTGSQIPRQSKQGTYQTHYTSLT